MNTLFEISTRGMLSARKATEVTSNNIANAHTPGFSRQRAVLTEDVQRLADGVFGRGVSVSQVERLRNELIDQQIMRKEHEIGDMSERANIYRIMESTLGTSSGLWMDKKIGEFFNAFSDLSNNQEDANLRKVVVSKSQMMSGTFNGLDNDLQALGRLAGDQAMIKLDEVNGLLQDVAKLNLEVSRSEAKGDSNNHAHDMQAQKFKELSRLAEFNTMNAGDGSMEVRIGGITVVSSGDAVALRAEVDEVNQSFRLRMPGGKLIDPGQGELAANIYMFENGVPEAVSQLDNIADALMERVNQVHSSGYGLDDSVQRNFFDLTATGAGTMKLNPEIIENPAHIAASSADGEPGNNDQALDIVNLQSERFVDGQTVGGKTIELMGLTGLKLNEIGQKMEAGIASRDFLVNRQEQLSGISIDEELTNLIRFQNSFQASARVLDAGRQMFDTLLSIT